VSEKQSELEAMQTELAKARKEADEQLAAEREASKRQFQTITDEATQKLSESEKRVAHLTDQLKSVSAERDALQSKLSENQSDFEAVGNELAKAKEAMQQANAKASELENAANEAKDAEAERGKMQGALDQANAEIERLKSELEQQKASQPEQGNSVSQPPGE
jgi:chromosome segregation ATPase